MVGKVDFNILGLEDGNSCGEAVTGYWVVGYEVDGSKVRAVDCGDSLGLTDGAHVGSVNGRNIRDVDGCIDRSLVIGTSDAL
jgi:hypothetical protein